MSNVFCIECDGRQDGHHTVGCALGEARAEKRMAARGAFDRGGSPGRYLTPDLKRLLDALGVSHLDYEASASELQLDPAGWLARRGWRRS